MRSLESSWALPEINYNNQVVVIKMIAEKYPARAFQINFPHRYRAGIARDDNRIAGRRKANGLNPNNLNDMADCHKNKGCLCNQICHLSHAKGLKLKDNSS